MFYQTRSNAIILQGTLPAHCIEKVERLKNGETLYERQYLSPRPPPKISLKHDLNWTKGNDQGSTVEHQPVGKLVQQSLGESVQFGSSKPTQSPKPTEYRTGQLLTQEIVGKSQGELSSSDRTGQLVKEEEKRVLKSHDRTGEPVEGSSHKVQEVGHLKNRDDGKALGCKEYHTANQLQKKCRKTKYDNIHDRFIRDKTFRKTMIELGRSEKIIIEMDQFASENHTHDATRAEINVYRGNWWIRSNVVNFDMMRRRHQPDFKELSTMYRLKKAEDEKQYAKWSQSSSSWWQW